MVACVFFELVIDFVTIIGYRALETAFSQPSDALGLLARNYLFNVRMLVCACAYVPYASISMLVV